MTAFWDVHPATQKGPLRPQGSNILCFAKLWPGRRGFVLAVGCIWKQRCACGDCSLTQVSCPWDRAGCSGVGPQWHCQPAGLLHGGDSPRCRGQVFPARAGSKVSSGHGFKSCSALHDVQSHYKLSVTFWQRHITTWSPGAQELKLRSGKMLCLASGPMSRALLQSFGIVVCSLVFAAGVSWLWCIYESWWTMYNVLT